VPCCRAASACLPQLFSVLIPSTALKWNRTPMLRKGVAPGKPFRSHVHQLHGSETARPCSARAWHPASLFDPTSIDCVEVKPHAHASQGRGTQLSLFNCHLPIRSTQAMTRTEGPYRSTPIRPPINRPGAMLSRSVGMFHFPSRIVTISQSKRVRLFKCRGTNVGVETGSTLRIHTTLK
jgi:hypothetical protein